MKILAFDETELEGRQLAVSGWQPNLNYVDKRLSHGGIIDTDMPKNNPREGLLWQDSRLTIH